MALDNLDVLFALKWWRILKTWKHILWHIQEKNHSPVNFATINVARALISDVIWYDIIECFSSIKNKQHTCCKYIVLIILQNGPIKLRTGQYQCPFCGRTMKNLGDIKRHMMRHTGEKPFACEYCNYSSIQKSSLKSHINSNHWNILKRLQNK